MQQSSPRVTRDPRRAEWAPLHEQAVLGARTLARQMRALQERYEAEHRRLADTLEFLSVQSRDLERELLEFSRLADRLEREASPGRGSAPAEPRPITMLARDAVGRLEARCLGGFEVRFQGRLLDLGSSRNGRAIFKYLVTCAPGRRAAKELLAELFWPDSDLERALASLQSAVHQLRRAVARSAPELGDSLIIFRDDHYRLNPGLEVVCDVDDFRCAVREARVLEGRGEVEGACLAYARAVEAYGGELLPEDRYEEWTSAERTSLEAELHDVLGRLVRLQLERGAYLEAAQQARRLIELDGTREDVHRDLMRCYSRLGQRSEAVRQYRRCAELLRAELEVEPESATTALFERAARGAAI